MTFDPGTAVRLVGSGEIGNVIERVDDTTLLVQFGDQTRYVSAADLEPVGVGDPLTRLASGDVGDGLAYAIRLQATFLDHAYRHDPVAGLSSARIEPQLHQVFVAHRVMQKPLPRMILADEVGLGKTIEAGLIVKELRARRLAQRVLIVCPASLQYQWQSELHSKFNEDFEIIDGPTAKVLGKHGRNPFEARDSVICSLTLASRDEWAERILEAGWDVVVFDEAHRVRRWRQGSRETTTKAYQLAERLQDHVTGLLMLTATPMQLHPFELYSLIELVEPGLFPTFEVYDRERTDLPRLNAVMKGLKEWPTYGSAQREFFLADHYLSLQELGIREGQEAAALDDRDVLNILMDEVSEKHPLAGVLVRNRKAEIGGFTRRIAGVYEVQLSDEELGLYGDISEYIRTGYDWARREQNQAVGFLMVLYQKLLASSSHALRESFLRRIDKLQKRLEIAEQLGEWTQEDGLDAADLDELLEGEELSIALDLLEREGLGRKGLEWEIATLEEFVARLGKTRDSKAHLLLEAADVLEASEPGTKFLAFTQFIATQEFLAHALEKNGFEVATFNGQMDLEEKERQVRRFRDKAQVLVTTEAGGEGRNFQFASVMFNYDLPWNPMKVEQRIGRLDRIGQQNPVRIFNFSSVGTLEERILDVLQARIGLFEESVGNLEPILGDVESDITKLILAGSGRFDEELAEYAADLETRVREAREQERVMADFALDHASFRKDTANELLRRRPLATPEDLRRFCSDALAYLGGSLDPHPDGGDSLAFSPLLAARMDLRGTPIRGIFEPRGALRREELPFLAFGHHAVDGLIGRAILEGTDTGARRAPDLGEGTWVEAVVAYTGGGTRPFGAMRRYVVGPDLEARTTELDHLSHIAPVTPPPTVPPWVDDAAAELRRAVARDFAAFRERAVQAFDDHVQEQVERFDRVADYRRTRLELTIARDQTWVDRVEEDGTPDERRVLPARKGRLRQQREQLDRLLQTSDRDREALRAQRAHPTAQIVAAGLAVGGAA